jgi:small subunit ribosomal protein S13
MSEQKTEPKQESKSFKYIVRILNTDLDGKRNIGHALTKIKGIKYMFSNAVLKTAGIDINKRTGDLNESEVARINEVLAKPLKFDIPIWMVNRNKDYETGDDMHLYGSDLQYSVMNDVKRMQKIKSYKGVRHSQGLPVRGQRTRSNFRKNKAKGASKKAAVRK